MYRLAQALLLFALVAGAQTNRGGITGTVTDKSGGSVPGAAIVVTNEGTNETQHVKTSDSGAFNAQNLDPVLYRVEVSATGFKKAIREHVKVDTASTTTLNLTLETGSLQSEVTVTDEAQLMNLDSGTASHTITQDQIDNSPLVNRSVLDLALVLPNVTGDAGSEDPGVGAGAAVPGYNLSINGGRAGSSMIMADGVNNTGVGVARAVVSFSPETIQEFSVQTNAYSAEFGRTGGGVINATTKGGTNQLHGTALWYQRNPATNAAPFTTATTNRPVSNTRDNQFSLAAGGPLVIPKVYNGKNRTFFFGAVEPRYRTDHIQVTGLMPTDAMRQGDFSGVVRTNTTGGDSAPVLSSVAARFPNVATTDATIYQYFVPVGNQLQIMGAPPSGQTLVPFPNNVIAKNLLDPVSQKLLQYVPQANTDYFIDPSGNLSNTLIQRFLKDNNTRYTGRIDHNISDRNHLNARATVVPVVGVTGYGSPVNGNGGNYSNSRQFMLSDTHIFSPGVMNDLRLNYTRGRFSGTFAPEWDVKTGRNLSTELGLPSLTAGGVPTMAIGLGTYGGIGAGGSTLGDNVEERYNVADAVYITKGRLTIKAGVDLTHELLNVANYLYSTGGGYNFRPYETSSNGTKSGVGGIQFATFLMGVPDSVSLNNALLPYYYRWNSGASWVQTDWKVKPNFTLNIGLRYSLQLPRTEKFNHQGTYLPSMAKTVQLAQPLTLLDGSTITSALIPPFAIDGMGGRSSYLWPASYHDFEPRLGFAWSPHLFGLGNRLAIRGGYGLSHSPLNGQNRQPLPSFAAPATTFGVNSGQTVPGFAMRLSSNPPNDPVIGWNQVLNVPSDGIVWDNSINYLNSGFAVSGNMRTPYAQNWNTTISYQFSGRDTIELAYVGNKGTHLFLPKTNENSTSLSLSNALVANNVSPTSTVNDPLGRLGSNGRVITVQQGTLGSKYLGFLNLYTWWNSAGDSIRHAAYVNYIHRMRGGLTLTSNYTFGKSIDDASDASPETNTLSTPTTIGGGSSNFGGSRSLDRSVSTFDVKHSFVTQAMYDLPFARRKFYGGWSVSGISRIRTGTPFMPTLRDNNGLGDNGSGSEYSIRPNMAPGVSVVNPLWQSGCPTTNLCEPYLNPAAFERPPLGQLGNAPRTIDGARGPLQRYLDLSAQKTFSFKEGRVRAQLRTDFLNAFNHPTFGVSSGYGGSNNWNNTTSQPSTAPITASQYDGWARANNQPLSNTQPGAAQLTQIQGFVTGSRNAKGALPSDFFTIPVPQGFATANSNSFDIRTPNGYKLWVLSQNYSTSFGTLNVKSIARYVQFGLKLYF
jgi:hypothetical protein